MAALIIPFNPRSIQTSPNAQLAFDYLSDGIPVIPCDPRPKPEAPSKPSKAPIYGYSSRKVCDDPVIGAGIWFDDHDALVGVPMGLLGLIAIDCDVREGKKGVEHFEALCTQHGGLPAGVVVIETVSGGLHFIMRLPPLMKHGNGSGALPPGIDVRCDGGYIIADGSSCEFGSWRAAAGSKSFREAYNDGSIPEMPQWLVDVIKAAPKNDDTRPLSERATATLNSSGSHADGDERRFIEEAIACIPPDGRGEWLKVGMGLFETREPWARDLWDAWSGQSHKYNAADQDRTWRGFAASQSPNKLSIGSVIELARKQYGFDGTKYPSLPALDPAWLEPSMRNLADQFARESGASGDTGAQTATAGATGADHHATRKPSLIKFHFDGDADAEPPPQLIKKLLDRVGVTFLGGQSGGGKTTLAINMATCLATGDRFFGHKVLERVGVVILAAEGASTIPPRLKAARMSPECSAGNDPLPIAWAGSIPDLNPKDGRSGLIADLKQLNDAFMERFNVRLGAVIVDTITAAFSIEDENSNSEATKVMRFLHQLANELSVAVIPVHHYGKSTDTGLRGASAWRASADGVLAVTADRNETNGRVSNRRLVLSKSRTGVEGQISRFDLQFVGLKIDDEGENIGACYLVRTDDEADGEKKQRPWSKMNRQERAYLDALGVKLGEGEKVHPFGAEGAVVTAVDREVVRKEFYASWPADGEDEEKRASARRKAFKRAEDGLIDRKKVQTREIGGRMMVWLVDEKMTSGETGSPT